MDYTSVRELGNWTTARNFAARIRRGCVVEGVAILSAMFSNEFVRDALRAHREGRLPTTDDPTRADSARS